MGAGIIALAKTSALFLRGKLAEYFEDILVLVGLGFVVRASFMLSPLAGNYTLGGVLVLLGLALSAGLKQQSKQGNKQ
ncbi:MAG: hypothetical protein FH749_06830 [Firmicutes bacterium]|nr:hypothetical protein [Bacillota bacterium]